MKVVTLVENTASSCTLGAEHGLCLYVETRKHRLLMDTGASDLLLRNAAALNVDLTNVDTVVLSHGHNDHGGGLPFFLEINGQARVYVQESAFDSYYSIHEKPVFIGLPEGVFDHPQIVTVKDGRQIDDELEIFSGICVSEPVPSANRTLWVMKNGMFMQDDFRHEQCLVINEDGRRVLMSGCAHHGILNIMREYVKRFGTVPDAVISGFHLRKKTAYTDADLAEIRNMAEKLLNYGTVFYTCHCTGDEPFDVMKSVMGDRLFRIRSGDILNF